MNFEPFFIVKVVAANLSKIIKVLSTAYAGLRKKRASDRVAVEKTISEGIKRYPDQSALGRYLRRLKEREIIRALKGLPLSPRELPAFYFYMEEDHANERDLRLAWPHRILSPEGTFDFKLGPFEHLNLWTSFAQALLYILSATCVFLMAGFTLRLAPLQAVGYVGMAFFLLGCSALPMQLSKSVRAAKRILYRRGRNR